MRVQALVDLPNHVKANEHTDLPEGQARILEAKGFVRFLAAAVTGARLPLIRKDESATETEDDDDAARADALSGRGGSEGPKGLEGEAGEPGDGAKRATTPPTRRYLRRDLKPEP